MLTKKRRRILFWLSVIFFAAILVPVFLFSFGYGLGPGFVLQKTGSIAITASVTNAKVLVDAEASVIRKKNTSLITKSALVKNLIPGRYSVSVKKEGFWEWQKNLKVTPEKVTAREALLVPLEVKGEIIGTTSPVAKNNFKLPPSVQRFWELPKTGEFLLLGEDKKFYRHNKPENKISTSTLEILRKSKNSFFSEDEQEIIVWDENKITLTWISDSDKMPFWMENEYYNSLSTIEPLRDVRNYPKHTDYLIVKMSNGIFAVEKEVPQNNIFPLYKGRNPKIISVENELLTIFDDNNYIKIELP
ncbi:MAG: hypothetical protein AAB522_03440 [Patescibacteria group bacterium]